MRLSSRSHRDDPVLSSLSCVFSKQEDAVVPEEGEKEEEELEVEVIDAAERGTTAVLCSASTKREQVAPPGGQICAKNPSRSRQKLFHLPLQPSAFAICYLHATGTA